MLTEMVGGDHLYQINYSNQLLNCFSQTLKAPTTLKLKDTSLTYQYILHRF